QASEPLFPAPMTKTRLPGCARRATQAGAPHTSRTASATASGRSSGRRTQSPVAKRIARPRTSRRSERGCTRAISSSASGVSVSAGSSTSACCGSTTRGRTTRRRPYGSAILVPGRRRPRRERPLRSLRRELRRARSYLRGRQRRGRTSGGRLGLEEETEQVDGDRKNRRRGLLRADLDERLQIAQLQRGRMRVDEVRRRPELLGGLVLALGGDDLATALALRLGLPGHGALHLGGKVDRLHLDGGDLDPPR